TAFFAPVVTTLVAVAVVWRYLLHTRYGLLNYALAHLGIHPIDWLGDPHWALPAIILFAVWKNFGYNMVIFLAPVPDLPRRLVRGGAPRRREPVAGVPPHHAADVASDPAAGEHPDGGGIFPVVRGAVCDDPGRAAAKHRQRAVLHVR